MGYLLFGLIIALAYVRLSSRIESLERMLESRDIKKRDTEPEPTPERQPARWEAPPALEEQYQSIATHQRAEAPARTPAETSMRDKEFEFKVGSKIFTGVGIVAILLGTAFFLRYAFENNLIDESMRVALGLLGGAVLLVLGWFTNKRYPLYGQAVTGGGIGLWYLSLFAAHNFYNILSQPAAFFFMIITTVIGASLARLYDSLPLASFAALGGFATPFLLPSNTTNPHTLFWYVALLDLGIFALAWSKPWQYLTLGGLVGTLLIYSAWFAGEYTKAAFGISFFYTSLFFLIFLFISFLHQFTKESAKQRGADIAIACINPAFYFLFNFITIDALYPAWTGLFAIALGVLYAALAGMMRALRSIESGRDFSTILFGISFLFFIVAVPIQFEKHWITIWWAALGLVLLVLGFALRMRVARLAAMLAFTLAFVRLFTLDITLAAGALPIVNTRFITFLFVSVLLALASMVFELKRREGFDADLLPLEKDEFRASLSFTMLALYVVSLVGLATEISSFHSAFLLPIVGTLWALGGGALALFVGNTALRIAAYLTFAATALRILFVEGVVNLNTYSVIANTRVGVTLWYIAALALFAAILRMQRHKISREEQNLVTPILFMATNGMLLWLVSMEVSDYFNRQLRTSSSTVRASLINMKRAALSVAWTLYAATLLVVGIVGKSVHARISSICLFGVVVVKVFLLDTENLNDFYRFVSFISLGVILLLSGFLYYRFRERIMEFIKAEGN